jgi:peptidoglycan/xylan/chitin deacetylase (PgdA/CDA1 family)
MMHMLLALMAMMATLGEPAPDKRIALSFDDAPRHRGAFLTPDERTERLIDALRAAGVTQAAFFVNPAKLDTPEGAGGEARLAAYVAAGHVLANHTFRHPNLLNVTAEAFLAEIDETEAWLHDRPGRRPWFRFPYLNEGGRDKAKRDAVRAGLRARGLSNGHVSADGSDWSLEALTVEAANAGKSIDMEALRRLYVTSQMSGIAYHDELARRTLGRSPAHVMLLHETDLAALFVGDLVDELRRHGWTIITMDEAYADPFYQMEPDVPYASGTLTGSVAWQQDIKPPLWPIWLSTESMKDLFQRRVVREATPPPTAP